MPKLSLSKPKKKSKWYFWATYFHFELIMTLSTINSFLKRTIWIKLNPKWCYWRFKFKHASWVPSNVNTHIVFWSSMSSMRIVLLSPWPNIMSIIRFQTRKHTKYDLQTWWNLYKLYIRNTGVIGLVSHAPQLLHIRFTPQNACCINKSTNKTYATTILKIWTSLHLVPIIEN